MIDKECDTPSSKDGRHCRCYYELGNPCCYCDRKPDTIDNETPIIQNEQKLFDTLEALYLAGEN